MGGGEMTSFERWRSVQIVPLATAVLCEDCRSITNSLTKPVTRRDS